MTHELTLTPRQAIFVKATQDEVLYGGAAGGGKSYGQLLDAMIYAMRYKGSKQLILRRTFPELDKSIIRTALQIFPRELYSYSASSHTGRFINGSLIDFGYCDNINDVYKYQSAEYDVIRFDELTHFEEEMYVYLISRLRGANDFPKQVKSSTNPGGVGHHWVKARFIDTAPPNEEYSIDGKTRIFIPAKVDDNKPLMAKDPDYKKRLTNLSENDYKALAEGCWDLFDGVFFGEFDRSIHTCRPRTDTDGMRWYIAMDYGLDMLAAYLIGVDDRANAYVAAEEYESNLIIGEAAKRIKRLADGHKIHSYLAPDDLWHRQQTDGRSMADMFSDNGIGLTKVARKREAGWMAVKEYLAVHDDNGTPRARLCINEQCVNLIRTLPALQYDPKNPNDTAVTPHELTHAPDALRYFCTYWISAADAPRGAKARWEDDQYEDYYNADDDTRRRLIEIWGDPF